MSKLWHFTHWHNSQSGAKGRIVCHSKDGTSLQSKVGLQISQRSPAKPAGSLLVKQLNQQKVQHPDLFSHFQAGLEDYAEMLSLLVKKTQVKPM